MSTEAAVKRPKGITPSQTVGPFFHYGLTPGEAYAHVPVSANARVAAPGTPGEHVVLTGRVLDGEGQPVPDAMLEIWQADAEGRYAHDADRRPRASNTFAGFGRADTRADGTFSFTTIKPGPVPGPKGTLQAPHVLVALFGRGMLTHLYTRFYFDDEADANTDDPILKLVPEDRRSTLVMKRSGSTYSLDIRLQGVGETVFFAV